MVKVPTAMRLAPDTSVLLGAGLGSNGYELKPVRDRTTGIDTASSYPEVPISSAAEEVAPTQSVVAGASGDSGAWQQGKHILAIWTINQNRNAWIGTENGWTKLSNSSDSGIVALSLLSANAREKGSVIDYRQEADGMIHEIYVW